MIQGERKPSAALVSRGSYLRMRRRRGMSLSVLGSAAAPETYSGAAAVGISGLAMDQLVASLYACMAVFWAVSSACCGSLPFRASVTACW